MPEYPSHLLLYGGEQVAYGEDLKYRVFLLDQENETRYSLDVPKESFEKVMLLLGFAEDNAEYCSNCGSIKTARPIIDSHGHESGYAYVCMCKSKHWTV